MREFGARIDRLNADLEHARGKAAEWQARVKDIERQITEQENLEILRVVRGMASSPEDLHSLLNTFRASAAPAAELKQPEGREDT